MQLLERYRALSASGSLHHFARSELKDLIKNNVSERYSVGRWYRFQYCEASGVQARVALYKEVGEVVAQYLKEDDVEGFVEWLNTNTRTRNKIPSLSIIESAFGSNDYICCNDCDYIEHYDDSKYCYEDYHVCSSCGDDYVWSERRETYVREDDYDDDDEEDDDDREWENIGSYHSSKRVLGHIPSSYDSRNPRVLLGLELEMECKDRDDDLDERAEHLLDSVSHYQGKPYALLEQDGSLNYGFEMVTGYTGLDVHEKQLSFFKERFEGMKSHDTKTCGLHIHICKSDMSIYHAMKMVLFINDSGNANLVRALARRDASSYAKFKDKKGDASWYKDAQRYRSGKADKLRGLNADRYEALNFQNEKTIEFRLFKGTLKYETIMACLEFTYATWFFCRDAGMHELTSEQFIAFIQKPERKEDTKYLRAYLTEKGFIQAKAVQENHLAVAV